MSRVLRPTMITPSLKSLILMSRLAVALLMTVAIPLLPTGSASADDVLFRTAADGYPCGFDAHLTRPGDEVFLVSSRCLPGGCGFDLPVEQLQVSRFEPGAGWTSSDWQSLTSSFSPSGLTSVYVHGNWMDTYWAQRRGWEMYHEVTRNLPVERPIRHIIWSWPTARERGALRATREHAIRADNEAYYLASYLATLPAKEQVSISAFSLGARSVSGALHLIGGGSLKGRTVTQSTPNLLGYRVVYFSAAVTYHAMLPGQFHQNALNSVDRMLNICNDRDKVLKHYNFVTRRSGDEAAGYECFALTWEQREKVQQFRAGNILGKEHSWDNVVCSRCLMDKARRYLQWQPL